MNMNWLEIRKHFGKQVVIRVKIKDEYKEKDKYKEYLGVIKDLDKNSLVLAKRTGKKTNDEDLRKFEHKDIISVISKDTITFVHPKYVPGQSFKNLQTTITHTIEGVKKQKAYQLRTRRYELQKNGTKKGNRWPVAEFEKEVAKWLTTKRKLLLCPVALITVGKQQPYLLYIDGYTGRLLKINKKGEEIAPT